MDKETLSNYGWIVICILVLSVMIALATPFGGYIGNAVKSTTQGLFDVSQKAGAIAGLDLPDQSFEDNGGGKNDTLDMSTVSSTLADNDWATIQKVAQAGKIAEAGWSVGDTKDLTINGATHTTTLIGINHDGANTATFMIAEVDGIGSRVMNSDTTNEGGWEASEMRAWLNSDVYDSMTDVAPYIKSVTKMTNNIGYNGNSVSATSDKVFLLSPKECGIEWQVADDDYLAWSDYSGMDALNAEGTTYEWFTNGGYIGERFWLRSPLSNSYGCFFDYDYGDLNYYGADYKPAVCPAFVIG